MLLCHLLDHSHTVIRSAAAHQSHHTPHPYQGSDGVWVSLQSKTGLCQPLYGQVSQLRPHLGRCLGEGLSSIYNCKHYALSPVAENLKCVRAVGISSRHIANRPIICPSDSACYVMHFPLTMPTSYISRCTTSNIKGGGIIFHNIIMTFVTFLQMESYVYGVSLNEPHKVRCLVFVWYDLLMSLFAWTRSLCNTIPVSKVNRVPWMLKIGLSWCVKNVCRLQCYIIDALLVQSEIGTNRYTSSEHLLQATVDTPEVSIAIQGSTERRG